MGEIVTRPDKVPHTPEDQRDLREGVTMKDPVLKGISEGDGPMPGTLHPLGSEFAGRYRILREIGRGGMGVVYAAYDEELDRRIALKVVRPGAGRHAVSQARMLREARAIAQLSHPNVVQVHDVGEFGGQIFLALELVRGQTLVEWAEAGRRDLAAILEVYIQAGRGLAAAHSTGLVHRDFKPANALVGEDGRVRVLDFGLARTAAETSAGETTEASVRRSTSSAETALTQTGTIVGTPAYMAPEQHLGEHVDARSDQFSFCVALWEAVTGARPFTGSTCETIRAAVLAGALVEPSRERRPPAALLAVLRRGLAIAPDERWPSMDALLVALERLRARRRGWLVLAAALAGGIVVGGLAALRGPSPPSCAAGAERLADAWNPPARARVRDAFFKTGVVYAEPTWSRVERTLDSYAEAWLALDQEACEATHVRGEQSETVLHLQYTCLHARRRELRALVEVFGEADGKTVQRAVDAVGHLRPVADCRDVERLLKDTVEPPAAESTEAVERLRAELARSDALRHAGQYDGSLEQLTTLVSTARQLDYPPVLAEALLSLGRMQTSLGRSAEAAKTLTEAWWTGLSSHHDQVALTAASSVVYVLGSRLSKPEEGRVWARHAEAMLARGVGDKAERSDLLGHLGMVHQAEGDYHGARALLEQAQALDESNPSIRPWQRTAGLNNLGTVCKDLGDYDAAEAYYRRSLAIVQDAYGEIHPGVSMAYNNLGVVFGLRARYAEAEQHYLRALEIARTTLGPDSTDVASTLNNLALVRHDLQRYDEAERDLLAALAIFAKALGPEHPAVGQTFHNLGRLYLDMGRLAEAETFLQRSLALRQKVLGPDHPAVAYTLLGLAALRREQRRCEEARTLDRRALAINESKLGPDHPATLETLTGLGLDELACGSHEQARTLLERVLAVQSTRSPSDDVPDGLADLQFGLAQALWSVEPERAVELAGAAEKRFESAPGGSPQLAEVQAWLQAHPPSPPTMPHP